MRIRPARAADFATLQEIERAAGEQFRPLGMDAVADDRPFSAGELTDFVRADLAWVAADAADVPVGYLVAVEVDGWLHIEQVTVHPRAARQGIGRELIEHAAGDAGARGLPGLTLTTFAEVAWNAPYYARLGFTVIPGEEVGPELRAVREHEAASGLDRWPRVCMRRSRAGVNQ